jgi:DnaJ family protein A protein 5
VARSFLYQEMPKICFYEVLGVERSAEDAEIKKSYRRLALEWHPDKNLHRSEEATERFKEIQEAYEVLSDPQERAWYDSHRTQILAGKEEVGGGQDDDVGINLWQYFSMRFDDYASDSKGGFFEVFRNLFEEIWRLEVQDDYMDELEEKRKRYSCPSFGNSNTVWKEVAEFYRFWENFASGRSFSWHDQYKTIEAPNRQVRRAMEKENKKFRDAGRKEYNELVRKLTAHAKRFDMRFLNYKNELAKQKAEKLEQEKIKKQMLEEERKKIREEWRNKELEKLRQQEAERDLLYADLEDKDFEDEKEDEEMIFECFICDKIFKSEKQFFNHEQSKKHKQAVEEFEKEIDEIQENEDENVLSEENLDSADVEVEEEDTVLEAGLNSGKKDKKSKKKKKQAANFGAEINHSSSDDIEERIQNLKVSQNSDHSDGQQKSRRKLKSKSKKNRKKDASTAEILPEETAIISEASAEVSSTSQRISMDAKEFDSDSDDTKRKKSRKKSKKQDQPASKPVPSFLENQCKTCGELFESKSKMFKHLKTYPKHAIIKQ